MDLKFKHLLSGLIVMSAATISAQEAFIGFGQDTNQEWHAKYYYAPLNNEKPAEDWYISDFDDSEWDTLAGPISTANGLGFYATEWPNNYSAYWLRSHFNVDDPSKFEGIIFKVLHDDGCTAYLNGHQIYNETSYTNSSIESTVENLLKSGDNVLAVYVADTGGGDAYIDFGIKAYTQLTVDVAIPGTLGDLILSQVENFSDVYSLKLSGKLNEKDIENLSKRLMAIRNLDISDLDMPEITEEMFAYRSRLSKIILPKNLKRIGNRAFYHCPALTEAIFFEGVESIGSSAFYENGLKEIILPNGLTYLGDCAFEYCTQNEYASLPPTLKTLLNATFSGNTNLARIDFSDGLEKIGSSVFQDAKELTALTFPSTLTTISGYAFAYCSKLNNIEFNEGLYQIGDNAFYDCDSLCEVTLPSTLVRADASPFDYCDNLRKVTCLSLEPPLLSDQIPLGCDMTGRELYVPALSVNIYKQTTGWDKFLSINPIDYLPENINILKDVVLDIKEELPTTYKPNLSLIHFFDWNSCDYGKLELNGDVTLSLNKFSYVINPYVTYEDYYYTPARFTPYCSFINNATVRADAVETVALIRSNIWTFITFPFDVKVSEITGAEEGTNTFVIRRYSGAQRAAGETDNTWITMGPDDILHANEGYIIQAVRYSGNNRYDYADLIFPSVNNGNKNKVFLSGDATVEVSEYPAEFEHNRGWNLVGNPYPSYFDSRFMDFEAPITVWDMRQSTYKVYSPIDDNYIFTPGESFFIQCPVGVSAITFNKDGRQKYRDAREINAPEKLAAATQSRIIANIRLSGAKYEDGTRVVINDNASLAYESKCDAAKFFSPDTEVAQLYTLHDDVAYAINERPLNNGEISLGLHIGIEGNYTISLTNPVMGYDVFLDDAITGESMRLNDSEGYAFTAKKEELKHRFKLRFVADTNAIGEITNDDESDDQSSSTIYTIDGKPVTNPVPGNVYVKDGKKIYIK